MDEALNLIYSDSDSDQIKDFLIENHHELTGQDNLYLNIFHHLAIQNKHEIIKDTLPYFDHSILSQKDLCGKTVLHFLAAKQQIKVLESILLVNSEASRVKDDTGKTMWHVLLEKSQIVKIIDLLQYLNKKDFHSDEEKKRSLRELWMVRYKDFQEKLWKDVVNGDMDLLKSKKNWIKEEIGLDVEIMQEINVNLLTEVVLKTGNLDILERYLNITSIPLSSEDSFGKSVVIKLLESKLADVKSRILIILEHENALNLYDNEARTPVHYLICCNSVNTKTKLEIFEKFLTYDSELIKTMLQVVDTNGDSALSLAVKSRDPELISPIIYYYFDLFDSSPENLIPNTFLWLIFDWPYFSEIIDVKIYEN